MSEQRVVRLTIDGHELQCPSGWTIYEAATAAGIHIPTFCHHPKLTPIGACRTCLVEVEGMRGLQTSCSTPVSEGMIVRVHTSPAAVKTRKAILEFLLTNHPLDCPVCDKGGECPLQDQAMADGPGQSRYIEPKRHKNKRYPLSELIVLDQERCVLCWRCIRFLDEWAGDHELDLFGRGPETRIDALPGRPLTSKWQGNTIDVCPVGALTSRVFRFEARVWELTNTPSICPLCSVGCNSVLGVKNNELRRITPRENAQVNDAWLCDRGRFAHGFVDHPDRLSTPLVRRDGQLQPATWAEALGLVARRFQQILQEYGPMAIGGLGSPRITNEANYLLQRFMRTVVGSNNIDHLGRFPAGAHPPASLADLESRDVILLLGFDPSTEAPLVELWIKKAVLRHGAQIVVAHPRRIELARYGGPWLSYRPGSEAVLSNGLARAILDALPQGRSTRGTNLEEFRTWLSAFPASQVEALAGVRTADLQRAAKLLADARRPLILVGPRWHSGLIPGAQSLSSAQARASYGPTRPGSERVASDHPGVAPVTNLSLLLGGADMAFVPEENNTLGALEMGVTPDLLPGQQPISDAVRSRLAGFWSGKISPFPGLHFHAMLAAAQEGNLHAMWVVGTDPAAECRIASEALGRIPFLVVQELFLTETAAMAEVVFPAASFAETDGTYINITGRLQAIRAARRPPGLARPDSWIVCEVAKRMVDSKRQRAWEFEGAGEILAEISKVVPGYRGLSLAAISEQGWQPPAPPAPARRTFARLESTAHPRDPEYPLTLVPGRLFYDRGTLLSRSDCIQRIVPKPFVMIHPADAKEMGLVEGEDVSVVSEVGRLRFRLTISQDVVRGVAYVPLNLSAAPLSVLQVDCWTLPAVRITK